MLIEENCLECINNSLKNVVAELTGSAPLKEGIEYALFPGGKRIRPLLSLMLFHDLGGEVSVLSSAVCALELVHTASLIHDDLPTLDNDDFRRGKPSLHKVSGEATALLVGDYLVPLAFQLVSRSDLSPMQTTRLVEALSGAYMEVCYGQMLDIEGSDAADLDTIHHYKTAPLFRASFEFASIAANLNDEHHQRMQRLGECVGHAFQIVDDYLDMHGTFEQTGRNESSDKRNNKRTFFTMNRLEEGVQRLQNLRINFERAATQLELMLSHKLAHTRQKVVQILDRVPLKM